MLIAHPILERIDDLLQRLNAVGCSKIGVNKRPNGQPKDLSDGIAKRLQLSLGLGRKADLLVAQLLRGFQQVYGMVRNTLQISDNLEELCDLGTVLLADLPRAELDEIGADDVLVMVGLLLSLADRLSQRGIVGHQTLQALFQCLGRRFGHASCQRVTLLNGNAGGAEEALVQLGKGIRLLRIRHDLVYQLLQKRGHGQKQDRAKQVKGGMRNGNSRHGRGLVKERGREDLRDQSKDAQPDHRSQYVEGQVNERRALGVLVRAEGGKDRGNAGSDVLSHDNGDRCTVGHPSRDGQSLQNTDRGRA